MPLVILLGGGSGAGKSTFAEKLGKVAGVKITVLNMDRYYLGIDKMSELGLGDNSDDPRAIDWRRLLEDVEKIRNAKPGEKIKVPVYDFSIHRRVGEEELVIEEVVVIDGLWALLDKNLRSFADLKIFVDVDSDIRLVRRIRRDIRERGRDLEEVLTRFLKYVKPMHEKWVEPTKSEADLIIPHGGRNSTALEVIGAWIRSRLTKR